MSHSPVFMLSSPTSCTKNILFFSKCLRTLGAHRQLHTQTAPARRPTPTQAERTASKPGRLQKLHGQEAAFLFQVATYRGSSHGTPRPPQATARKEQHLSEAGTWKTVGRGDLSISGAGGLVAQKSITKITLKH